MVDRRADRAGAARCSIFAAQAKLKIATAESCTGGLVAATLTEIAGSSDVVERGFVTYSNAAKRRCSAFRRRRSSAIGAVSRETAEAMAEGALAHAPVDLAVSITGIAGPGGGTAGKPVGLVHFAAAARGGALDPPRARTATSAAREVRRASVLEALAMLRELAEKE